jgi:hypothetical protein
MRWSRRRSAGGAARGALGAPATALPLLAAGLVCAAVAHSIATLRRTMPRHTSLTSCRFPRRVDAVQLRPPPHESFVAEACAERRVRALGIAASAAGRWPATTRARRLLRRALGDRSRAGGPTRRPLMTTPVAFIGHLTAGRADGHLSVFHHLRGARRRAPVDDARSRACTATATPVWRALARRRRVIGLPFSLEGLRLLHRSDLLASICTGGTLPPPLAERRAGRHLRVASAFFSSPLTPG